MFKYVLTFSLVATIIFFLFGIHSSADAFVLHIPFLGRYQSSAMIVPQYPRNYNHIQSNTDHYPTPTYHNPQYPTQYQSNQYPKSDKSCQQSQLNYPVSGAFYTYWQQGGINIGCPVSGEFQMQTPEGPTLTVQYFERQRLEWHPENQWPYQVEGGLLGREDAQMLEIDDSAPFQPVSQTNVDNSQCHYFSETQHSVCRAFLSYYQSNGYDFNESGISYRESVALFGYPISEEFQMKMQDGNVRTVQYFERARFEWHPENQSPYDVQLGRIGVELLQNQPNYSFPH